MLVLLGFGVGAPVAVAASLYRHRHELDSPYVQQRLLVAYYGYRPSRFYWEMVVMLRKALLTAVSVVITGSAYQVTGALTVLVASLALQLGLRPFNRKGVARLENMTLLVGIFTMLAALVFVSDACPGAEPTSEATQWLLTTCLIASNVGACVVFAVALVMELHGAVKRHRSSSRKGGAATSSMPASAGGTDSGSRRDRAELALQPMKWRSAGRSPSGTSVVVSANPVAML